MEKKRDKKLLRQGSVSENFFAVNHASLILPKYGSPCEPVKNMKSLKFGGDLKTHLYAIIRIVRPQDQIKLVARLQSWDPLHIRYLVIVSTIGRQDTEESLVLGIDFDKDQHNECTIGLVIPIYNDMTVELDGDGGFQMKALEKDEVRMFKPISVQAMWSALQAVHHCIATARRHNYFTGGLYLTWTCYYESRVQSSRIFLNEWEHDDFVWTRRPNYYSIKDKELENTERQIREVLKQVMMRMDLDNCTCRDIREELEKATDLDLTEFKSFIYDEMVVILQQLEASSKILDYLYLGSAWNAADAEQLEIQGITHILNITVEVDNYFPGNFAYKNVRLYDEPQSDLLPWWNQTYKFIKGAMRQGGKCLVHCKMGISRSSATVTAFVMKELQYSMEKALEFVRERRPIILPNLGFMDQLREYEGILKASSQRHNALFRSLSESNLSSDQSGMTKDEKSGGTQPLLAGESNIDFNRRLLDITSASRRYRHRRSKSWTAGDLRYSEEDDIFLDLYGDDITEPHSEPQGLGGLKSSGMDKMGEPPRTAFGRKKKRKLQRRHTDIGGISDILQSDESVVANSDCGVITNRYSWGPSSITSSEDNADVSRVPRIFGKSTVYPRDRSAQQPEAIDEVFEKEDLDTDTASDQPSVKNIVSSIESKYSSRTHSRAGSDLREIVVKERTLSQNTDPNSQSASTENPNSNNNSSKPSAAPSEAKVVIIPLPDSKVEAKPKEYRPLTEEQLRIIREVGLTFIGEKRPSDSSLSPEKDAEPGSRHSCKVRKGLVKRMARTIESGQAVEPDREASKKEEPAEHENKLSRMRSFDAPTPYNRFQQYFATGSRAIKKSVSFNKDRYRRGVTRTQSERVPGSRMHPVVIENCVSANSADTEVIVNSNGADKNLACTVENGEQNSKKCHQSNLNRIDRQNSLYKSI